MRVLGLVILIGLGLISSAKAQSPTLEEVQRWLDAEWEKAATLPNLGDARLEWETHRVYVPPAAEMNQLRAAVEGRPDHPDRLMLKVYELRASGRPEVFRHILWSQGEGAWRHSKDHDIITDFDRVDRTYTDIVVRKDEHWSLSPKSLLIEPSDVQPGSPAGGLLANRSSLLPQVSWILDGGLRLVRNGLAKPRNLLVTSDKFRFETVIISQGEQVVYRMSFSGRWSRDASRGFIERAELTTSGFKPDSRGESYEITGWTLSEQGIWFAKEIVKRRSDGQVEEKHIVRSFGEVPGQDFAAVTATPSPEGTDPVRGSLTVDSVSDLRAGLVVSASTGESMMIPDAFISRPQSSFSLLRVVGWASSACLLVGFGLLFYRRHFGKRVSS
jgi:hypothetical protein